MTPSKLLKKKKTTNKSLKYIFFKFLLCILTNDFGGRFHLNVECVIFT